MAVQVGDGTTTVVLLASEFLKEAKTFIDDGVHPRVRLQDIVSCQDENLVQLLI